MDNNGEEASMCCVCRCRSTTDGALDEALSAPRVAGLRHGRQDEYARVWKREFELFVGCGMSYMAEEGGGMGGGEARIQHSTQQLTVVSQNPGEDAHVWRERDVATDGTLGSSYSGVPALSETLGMSARSRMWSMTRVWSRVASARAGDASRNEK